MYLHTKFNIGDKVFLTHSHCQRNPVYIKTELFKDKDGKEEFEVESVKILAGEKYCIITYTLRDFHEIFLPDEHIMFGTKEEALAECNKRSLKSCKGFENLEKVFTHERKRTELENQAYKDEVERLQAL